MKQRNPEKNIYIDLEQSRLLANDHRDVTSSSDVFDFLDI